MDFFNVLSLIGGLSLFLFGMNIMGSALERRAGSKLRNLLQKLTSNKLAGFFTGAGVTAIIQSSSATTVMVVGFVNSGLMCLKEAINVIMGANVGTTITAWILSLSGISSDNFVIKMLKPSSFTPILALIGIAYFMFSKSTKKKDTGMILLGFATLMTGMEAMSGAVSGLSQVEGFRNLFIMFTNPLLGVCAGAILTAIIQSSSASVGILQALASTGQVTYGAAVPIIMGQNIGTCITAIISSIGATKNAKRASFVHLAFNVIGTAIWLLVYWIIKATVMPIILTQSASLFGIAIVHSLFNIGCVLVLLPMSSLLERLAYKFVPDSVVEKEVELLDIRLLNTPSIAIERCENVIEEMLDISVDTINNAIDDIWDYTDEKGELVCAYEKKVDEYEDQLGTFIVELCKKRLEGADSRKATTFLKIIGDLERISDHGKNIMQSGKELSENELTLSESARNELSVLANAVKEVVFLMKDAFINNDVAKALKVEPLEEAIDSIKETIRTNHTIRVKQGDCSIKQGFILNDILTDLERVSDHCSNIAGCIIDIDNKNLNTHYSLDDYKLNSSEFIEMYKEYKRKYQIA